MRPITIIVNESSGGAAARGAALEDALARAGLNAAIVRVRGPEIVAASERAAGPQHVLVAAGGDGTVSSVASVAVKTGSTFGVIPLGTLNHFARDAGIPLEVEAAIAVIAAGHTRAMPVGDMNGSTFLNNISLGLYPRLVWEREAERCRGRGKWTAFALALLRTWRRYSTVDVRLTIDTAPLVRHTPFVFIGNGEYRTEGLGLGTRASLDTGTLALYLAPGVDRFEFLTLPVRAVARRLTAGVKFETFTAGEVTIETPRITVEVALDGELRSVSPPIRCTVRPRALHVMLPEAA